MQLDHPDILWQCPFCSKEQGTFLALRAHIDKNHEGQLFRFECGKCGFQAESPTLLRKHQTETHTTDIARADEPGNKRLEVIQNLSANSGDVGAAIPATTGGTEMADQTEQLKEGSLREDFAAHNN